MNNDPLMQPFAIKHLHLKNRIIITSHEPAYPEDGLPKARYRAYHAERAKGGVAMTMTAGSAVVSQDSPPSFNNLLAYKDEIVPWIKELVDSCHEYDCKVMMQITHLGRRTFWNTGDWLPTVSPTHEREIAHKAIPKLIEDWDIERIVKDYADAAERLKNGGIDGIELEAYGHLLDSFWSPSTNKLSSPYNGSLEERMRVPMDILKAIRERIGNDFIVGVRCVLDEMKEGGITPEDGIQIAQSLKDSGLVDFFNIIRGRIDSDPELSKVIPLQGMPSAPHLDFAGEIRKITKLPTFHAAKIQDVATARHAISSGKLDMVGMTRAHIADPHIVQKIMQNREENIRPCVGATYCLDRIYQGGEALCIHNAATGRELQMPHVVKRARKCKKIIIVGAGAAGLEAARVAAERGHEVVVYEAAPDAGGQIRLIAKNTRRSEMASIIDWRLAQCAKHDVTFHYNTWIDGPELHDESGDIIIVATGGFPNTDLLKQGNEYVHSTWDIISGDIKPGRNVLIFDDAGDNAALQAAEVVAKSGAKLEILTPDRTFASEIMGINLVPYIQALQWENVTFNLTYRLLEVSRDGSQLTATIGSDYTKKTHNSSFDQVIINHGTLPLDDLYFQLKGESTNLGAVNYADLIAGKPQNMIKNPNGKFQLFRIGDAVSSRNIHAAIYDALRLVKDL